MALFRRNSSSASRVQDPPGAFNMLTSDAIFVDAAMAANSEFRANGWPVRVAGVRMMTSGGLEVALVVPDHPGGMVPALDALPGHEPVFGVVSRRLGSFGHKAHGLYFNEEQWSVEKDLSWRYNG